jgi:hypothetical protein
MNKKYQKYIEYIVNDIESPYFINMIDNYGLKDNEYELVLSKVFNQPLTIKGNNVFDQNNNRIYQENSNGHWYKYGYDANGNEIYRENSTGFWRKYEYDTNGNILYYEDSYGSWTKREYDTNSNLIYHEDSTGVIIDNR